MRDLLPEKRDKLGCACVHVSPEHQKYRRYSRDKEGEGLHRSTLYTEIHLHLYLLYWYRRPMFIESAKMRKCVLLIRMEGTIICRSIGCHGTSRSLSHLSLLFSLSVWLVIAKSFIRNKRIHIECSSYNMDSTNTMSIYTGKHL